MADFIDLGKDIGQALEKAKQARERVDAVLMRGVEKALLVVEASAKANCPVDDGRLRSSITHTVEASDGVARGRVGTNVNYGPYVHDGTGIYARNGNGRKKPWAYKHPKTGLIVFTHGQKPQPFLRDALEENKDRIAQIFKEAVDEL